MLIGGVEPVSVAERIKWWSVWNRKSRRLLVPVAARRLRDHQALERRGGCHEAHCRIATVCVTEPRAFQAWRFVGALTIPLFQILVLIQSELALYC